MLHPPTGRDYSNIHHARHSQSRDSTISESLSRRSTPRSDMFTRMEPLFPQYAELHSSQAQFAREEPIPNVEAKTEQKSKAHTQGYSTTETIELRDNNRRLGAGQRNSSSMNGGTRNSTNNDNQKHKTTVMTVHTRKEPDVDNNTDNGRVNDKQVQPRSHSRVTQPLHLHTGSDMMITTGPSPDRHKRSTTTTTTAAVERRTGLPGEQEQRSPPANQWGIENVQVMRADLQPSVSISYLPRPDSRLPGGDRVSTESSPRSLSPRPSSGPQCPSGTGLPESDLAFRRVTSTSGFAGKSSYSAHRERLRQEREQELLMRQQQSQRQRQMAASSTGLHEQHSLQQQSRHQQQYRSLSAVNQTGATEAFEEIETIILQPIGRGVQDIDSRVGSMTMLSRGPGGSLMDGSATRDLV